MSIKFKITTDAVPMIIEIRSLKFKTFTKTYIMKKLIDAVKEITNKYLSFSKYHLNLNEKQNFVHQKIVNNYSSN